MVFVSLERKKVRFLCVRDWWSWWLLLLLSISGGSSNVSIGTHAYRERERESEREGLGRLCASLFFLPPRHFTRPYEYKTHCHTTTRYWADSKIHLDRQRTLFFSESWNESATASAISSCGLSCRAVSRPLPVWVVVLSLSLCV